MIRSCLASAEALESYLIPSVFSNSNDHSALLEMHWLEEMAILQRTIQDIIDTHAFCSSLIDHLNNTISLVNRKYNADAIAGILSMSEIMLEHLRVNYDELKLDQVNSARRLHFDDLKLMLDECRAAFEICSPATDAHRIIKRIKILLSVVKKLKATLSEDNTCSKSRTDDFTFGSVSSPESQIYTKENDCLLLSMSMQAINRSDATESGELYFKSFGIEPSMRSNFYENKSIKMGHKTSNVNPVINIRRNKSKLKHDLKSNFILFFVFIPK